MSDESRIAAIEQGEEGDVEVSVRGKPVWGRLSSSLNSSPTSKQDARNEDFLLFEHLRYVRPYHFEFKAFVKRRWVGKSAVDVFTTEFLGRSRCAEQCTRSASFLQDMPCGQN